MADALLVESEDYPFGCKEVLKELVVGGGWMGCRVENGAGCVAWPWRDDSG